MNDQSLRGYRCKKTYICLFHNVSVVRQQQFKRFLKTTRSNRSGQPGQASRLSDETTIPVFFYRFVIGQLAAICYSLTNRTHIEFESCCTPEEGCDLCLNQRGVEQNRTTHRRQRPLKVRTTRKWEAVFDI